MLKYAIPVVALAAACAPAGAATVVYNLGATPSSEATLFSYADKGRTLQATAGTYTVAPTALDLLSEISFGKIVRREAGGLGVNSSESPGQSEQVDNDGINEVVRLAVQGRQTRLVSAKFNFVDDNDTLRVYGQNGTTLTLLGLLGTTGFTGEFFDNTASDSPLGNGAVVTGRTTGSLTNATVFDVSFDKKLGSYDAFLFTARNDAADGYRLQQVSLAVPEPATWALMVGGFGFVGAMSRRRKASLTLA